MIEKEVHFLIDCDIYDDLRVEMFVNTQSLILISLILMLMIDFFIMNCTPYLYAPAKLVFTMYNRRKSFT